MNKSIRWLSLFIALLISGNVLSQVPEYSEDQEKAWIGHYPFEEIAGNTFFESFNLPLELELLLPESSLGRLNTYHVMTPIVSLDNYLVFKVCLAHQCHNNKAIVVFNVGSQVVVISMTWPESMLGQVFYLYSSEGNPQKLPDTVLKALITMDIPR